MTHQFQRQLDKSEISAFSLLSDGCIDGWQALVEVGFDGLEDRLLETGECSPTLKGFRAAVEFMGDFGFGGWSTLLHWVGTAIRCNGFVLDSSSCSVGRKMEKGFVDLLNFNTKTEYMFYFSYEKLAYYHFFPCKLLRPPSINALGLYW